MNLEEARATVRSSVLNVGDSSTFFSDERVDRGIRAAGKNFLLRTRCSITNTTLSTVASQDYVDVSATGFFPGLVVPDFTYISTTGTDEWQGLRVVNFGDMRSWKLNLKDADEDCPQYFSFRESSRMYLHPTPDAVYSIELAWTEPFVSWTIGTTSPASVDLNIPDEYVDEFLTSGAKLYLLWGLEDYELQASVAERKYESFVREVRNRAYPQRARVVGAPFQPTKPAAGERLRDARRY